jgi:HK97 family phage major capsid protein
MGVYLDRLHAQYDEIQNGVTEIANRAADDNRDINDDEQKVIDRDKARMAELETAITYHTDIDAAAAKVTALRDRVPAARQTTTTAPAAEDAYDVAREFSGPGDYAITVHRAAMYRDAEAVERLNRATAHQTTADNPGIIPRPVLGPVINLIDGARPFVNSCSRKALPAGSFDRPVVTQHVAVDLQAAEKDLTASRDMQIGKIPVSAKTFAGHLNISRQDIKWTSPGILNIVFEDFATVYAIRTCDYAATEFLASITNTPVGVSEASGSAVTEALYGVAAASLEASNTLPDTLYVAPDVWAALGGMSNANSGLPAFPSLSVTNTAGNPLGLSLVVDAHFPNGTMIAGPSKFNEFYEDVDGLMQVQEPDVLGQLVGYAGFAAYVNTVPAAFTPMTLPAPAP